MRFLPLVWVFLGGGNRMLSHYVHGSRYRLTRVVGIILLSATYAFLPGVGIVGRVGGLGAAVVGMILLVFRLWRGWPDAPGKDDVPARPASDL